MNNQEPLSRLDLLSLANKHPDLHNWADWVDIYYYYNKISFSGGLNEEIYEKYFKNNIKSAHYAYDNDIRIVTEIEDVIEINMYIDDEQYKDKVIKENELKL